MSLKLDRLLTDITGIVGDCQIARDSLSGLELTLEALVEEGDINARMADMLQAPLNRAILALDSVLYK